MARGSGVLCYHLEDLQRLSCSVPQSQSAVVCSVFCAGMKCEGPKLYPCELNMMFKLVSVSEHRLQEG